MGFKNHILHWCRYVDDVFAIFRGSEADIEEFVSDINKIHSNIKFTYKTETNNSISFLDLRISKVLDSLSFEIYRKYTYTDHVIPFESHHPMPQKLSDLHSYFQSFSQFHFQTTVL